MPGNEVGDRVHNFFAQDNSPQGQHHPQAVDGSWPVLNNTLWVGSQRQSGVPNSYPKNYNLQPSDLERGHSSHSLHVPHGLNMTPSPRRSEFSKSQPQSQQPSLNGYMYAQQMFQPRQDEANFLGVDTESDRHNLNSRGFPAYELQQGSGPEHLTHTSVRSETSETPVSLDLFGGQHQMSTPHQGMVQQSLPQQQSRINDMQQLQQQVMLRKLQELQRQKELRQQNSANQISSFARQASNHSPALINGTPISDVPWTTQFTAGGPNWMQRASPAIQGSSTGLVYSPEHGQPPRSLPLAAQQVDQSLYGVPISSSRGSLNQYSSSAIDKPSAQQTSAYGHSFPGNQYAAFSDQVAMQDGISIGRQGSEGGILFGHSDRGLGGGMTVEHLQQLSSLQGSATVQEFQRRQEPAGPSEAFQGKTAIQDASAQNTVALDPTEEKILFGSDDNIWDAFGSNVTGGTSNLLEGTGIPNGFPSVQSGSWSALMQSAVAETSSSDVGLQEEWTGLSYHNPGNQQRSTYDDSGKNRSALADDNLQLTSAPSLGSLPPSDGVNMSNYQNVPGFQHLAHKLPNEHGERLQTHSSQRPIFQSSGGNQWLTRGPPQKPLAGGSQIHGDASHSPNAELNAQRISGHWSPQQSQPYNKPNIWNVSDSVLPSGNAVMNRHRNEKSLQDSSSNGQNRVMREDLCHGDGIWKANSTAEMEPVKSSVQSPQMNGQGFSLNSTAASIIGEEASELLSNNNQLNYWKHVDSLVNSKGSYVSRKLDHHMNNGPQILESLNGYGKEGSKVHGMENINTKDDTYDNYNSNLDASDSRTMSDGKLKSSNKIGPKTSGPRKFQYHPMGNVDEDVGHSYGARQPTPSQAMPQQSSRGVRNHDQGYFGKQKLFRQRQLQDLQGDVKGVDEAPSRGIIPGSASNVSASLGRSMGFYAPDKDSQPSQNMLELLHKVDQSREHGTMMHFSPSECNPSSEMPEAEHSDGSAGLFQRSHSSASQGFGLQLAPPLQRLPVSNHASHSSTQIVNSFGSNQVTSEIKDEGRTQFPNSSQSLPASHEMFQGEPKNNRYVVPGQTGTEASAYKMPENLNSGFPNARSQPQNQLRGNSGVPVSTNQSFSRSLARHSSLSKEADDSSRPLTGQSAEASLRDAAGSISYENTTSSGEPTGTIQFHERVQSFSPGEAVSDSQPFITSGISQPGSFSKMLPNMWTNVPAQQHFPGSQAHKVSSKNYQSHQSNILESGSSTPENVENQDAKGSILSELVANSVNLKGSCDEQMMNEVPCQPGSSGNINLVRKMNESARREPIVNHLVDPSPAMSALSQRDIEAFGRSLKPNSLFHQSYSLLNQVQAMKNAETDPMNSGLKLLKASDNVLDGQQVAPKTGQSNECISKVGDALARRTAVPSGDARMLSFTAPADNLQRNASSQPGNLPSQDVLAVGQNESQTYSHSSNTASVRAEHTQISPQMAPSWFNQYGTFKNGQILPMYGARQAAIVKSLEQPFNLGKSSSSLHTLNSTEQVNAAADTSQVGDRRKGSSLASIAIDHISSSQSLPPDVGGQNSVVLRPKKRKIATSVLHPWHKEVSLFRSPQTISMSEVDWAKSANRLSEKFEEDAGMNEDGLPMHRPRRRLTLTTQLMQQLLSPPSATILSSDASSNHECVAYFAARLALGDACSLVCSNVPCSGANFLSDTCQTSERTGDQHLSEVMEDFMARARKLENDLLRLDKRASVLDLRVECQDLEKFSVINRFAKFHGRGQADGAETSSSSDAAASAQKPSPQRYVTASPFPRNLPDRVQCLSL
ncbi:hypothetical protein RJ640_003269 [Escallonia rubra]|uniref:Uncharacterized protein n=1 Tax=Escallonia rubra TaxID=112253 RepID=A0AA88U7V4_9ASTE|nr:hypothetical protein RJ640_003269 [Escallonia rubra]